MDGNIRVSFAGLDTLATDIRTQVNAVEANLEDLITKVNQLREAWVGEAAEQFRGVFDTWNNAANELRGVLKNIELTVMASNDGYQSTEKRNAGRFA